MRAYFFGNFYLSSIQQGIQAAHVVTEMFIGYPVPPDATPAPAHYLYNWAESHKTMILLNGGMSDNLRDLIEFFEHPENPYPWASFHEGQDALDGALTDVGIVLPEKIYNTAALTRGRDGKEKLDMIQRLGTLEVTTKIGNSIETENLEFSKWEYELLVKLNTFGLAK